MENSQLNQSWWSLRITYGLVAFLAGLDKFFHILTNWDNYLSPMVASLAPVSVPTLMHVVGIIEMAVGLSHPDAMDPAWRLCGIGVVALHCFQYCSHRIVLRCRRARRCAVRRRLDLRPAE